MHSMPASSSIVDDAGKVIPFKQDALYPNTNEFLYAPLKRGSGGYTLTIPAIKVTKKADDHLKITVPVPETGSMQLNKQFNLFGYPIDVLKVERSMREADGKPTIRIYFDVHYDASQPESLMSFMHDLGYMNERGGVSGGGNGETMVLEYMEVDVKPDARERDLYFNEATFLVRGPWQFQLNGNSTNP